MKKKILEKNIILASECERRERKKDKSTTTLIIADQHIFLKINCMYLANNFQLYPCERF